MEEVEFIATIQDGLMCVCLSALAAIAAGVVGAWLCRSAQCAWARAWRSRSWFEQGVLVGLLSVCVLFGGEKTRSGVGPLGDRALPGVTAEEIAQGWRLESVAVHQGLQVLRSTLARGLREGRGKVK